MTNTQQQKHEAFPANVSFPHKGKGNAAPTKWFSPVTAKDQPTTKVASDFRT